MVAKDDRLSVRMSRRALLTGTAAAASAAAAYALLEGLPGGARLERPYDESAAIESDSVKISHLLRRAGFGTTREEFQHYQSIGLQATVDELVHYKGIDDSAADALAQERDAQRGAPQLPWLVRMANTRRPLQEKMTLFWHGLLTTEQSAVPDAQALTDQNDLFRRNATGNLRDLLIGITHDRAMMVYLDIDGSVKSAPNENYARELMELFSMGAGNYSEEDVREAARAFTGWHVPRQNPNNVNVLSPPVFRPELYDDGQKSFFGRTGSFGPDDIVEIILEQPATGRYLVRRLFEFFVYPEPADDVIDPFVEVYEYSGREISPVVEAMFKSEVFYSRRAYRALAKSPVEYTVGAIKAIGAPADTTRLLAGRAAAVRNMGQVLFDPPNVAGWPSGAVWFSSSAMLARLNFVNQITGGAPIPDFGRFGGPPGQPTPAPTPTPTPPAGLGTASYALSYYLPFVLDDILPDEAREVLLEHAGGPRALLNADKLRGLVYLILASPQNQLN